MAFDPLSFLIGQQTAKSGGGSGGGESGDFPLDKYFEGGYAEVNLPNAEKIKRYAFYGDPTLTNITMPKVESIGDNVFRNCTNLALTSLPSGLTQIGEYAFYGCSKLALTSLPSGLTQFNRYVFSGCSKLALTFLPDELALINSYAFENCTGLTTLTFKSPPSIARGITTNAFKGCTNLTTINVPWAEGEVANAPWGATNATINYNYTGG